MVVTKAISKPKVYEQSVIRTMFFEKLRENQPTIKFDGQEYPVSNPSNVDIWNCRQHLAQEIWPKFDVNDIDDLCQATNFKVYKTEVQKVLKKWDNFYNKH